MSTINNLFNHYKKYTKHAQMVRKKTEIKPKNNEQQEIKSPVRRGRGRPRKEEKPERVEIKELELKEENSASEDEEECNKKRKIELLTPETKKRGREIESDFSLSEIKKEVLIPEVGLEIKVQNPTPKQKIVEEPVEQQTPSKKKRFTQKKEVVTQKFLDKEEVQLFAEFWQDFREVSLKKTEFPILPIVGFDAKEWVKNFKDKGPKFEFYRPYLIDESNGIISTKQIKSPITLSNVEYIESLNMIDWSWEYQNDKDLTLAEAWKLSCRDHGDTESKNQSSDSNKREQLLEFFWNDLFFDVTFNTEGGDVMFGTLCGCLLPPKSTLEYHWRTRDAMNVAKKLSAEDYHCLYDKYRA